jgi:S-adenosylmethionine:tRNA ribosyltransferase-isomerase
MLHPSKLSDYQFDLPEELIAQTPAVPRDHSRLLVYDRKTGVITDAKFYEILEYLPADSTLVLNNSKVEKARLLFGNVEIFEVLRVNDRVVEAMVRPGRKFKLGKEVDLGDGISATVQHVHDDGLRTLRFNVPLDDPAIERHRFTPFPPYIEAGEDLAPSYQTVYARDEGSKAAPTAGLHFTEELLTSIRNGGHPIAEVTLHVGLGTFAPVKTDNITDHKMHHEYYSISDETAETLNHASGRVAVGTTSVRVLESAISDGTYHRSAGSTDIFITPGYTFKGVDALITNFHLPGSTLLMLVSAFAGYQETMRIYKHAIENRYRFFSFGDAMLIL